LKLSIRVNPNYPFSYQFVDEEYQKLYSTDLIIDRLSVLFATLGIGISCLGLLGLVMFSAEQRVKEIGIRKVLGASLNQIISLLTIDLLKLVLVAFLISAPIAWLAMHRYLENFAYRIEFSWWIFAVAAVISILISFLTVVFQAVTAAAASPANNLRTQ